MTRIFLDSSVLFSAAYSPKGYSRDLILMAAREEVTIVISQLVLTETRRNLAESTNKHVYFLDLIIANIPFEYVRPTKRDIITAAKNVVLKDAPIVAAAKKAKVDLLITLDKKHLLGKPKLSKFVEADIVTPNEAVYVIGLQN